MSQPWNVPKCFVIGATEFRVGDRVKFSRGYFQHAVGTIHYIHGAYKPGLVQAQILVDGEEFNRVGQVMMTLVALEKCEKI